MKKELKLKVMELINDCFKGYESVNCFNDCREKLSVDNISDIKSKVNVYSDYRRIDLFSSNDYFNFVKEGDEYKNKVYIEDVVKKYDLNNKIKNVLKCEEVVVDSVGVFCGRFSEYNYCLFYK